MATLATLVVRLVGDTAEFAKALDESRGRTERWASQVGGQFMGLGDSVVKFGAIAAGVAVGGVALLGTALTALGAIGLKEAMEAEVVGARLDAVLAAAGDTAGITGRAARDLAMRYRDLAGGSDDVVLGAEAILLRFKNLRGDAFEPALQTTLDLAAALGTDAASAAAMLGRALELPGQGMRALMQAGVVLTDEQRDMIDEMVEAGDVASAQKFLMDALAGSIGGTAAKMADTLSGRMAILKGHLMENAETIGNALLPFVNDLVEGVQPLIDKLGIMLPNFIETKLKPALERVADFLRNVIPEAVRIATDVWENTLMPGFQALSDFWTSTLQPIFAELVTWLQEFLPEAMQFLKDHSEEVKGALMAIGVVLAAAGIASAIAGIAGAVAALATPIGVLIAVAALLGAAWAGNWGGIRDKVAEVWAFLQPIFQAIGDWLSVAIPAAVDFLKAVWEERLKPIFDFWAGVIQNVLLPILGALAGVITAVVGKAIEFWVALWTNKLQPALQALFSWIGEKLQPVMQALSDFIRAVFGPAFTWLKTNVIDPAIKGFGGIVDAVKKVVEWLQKVADMIRNIKIPKWLEGSSPSPMEMWFRGIGGALGELNRIQLPAFSANLSGMAPAGAIAGTGAASNTTNITIHGARIDDERSLRERISRVRLLQEAG